MGTKLRAGGPAYCLMSDDRVAITHIWEGPQEVHAVFGDGSRGYHSIDNFTPAPFIPGDVVEHSTFPAYGRGVVTEVIESTAAANTAILTIQPVDRFILFPVSRLSAAAKGSEGNAHA